MKHFLTLLFFLSPIFLLGQSKLKVLVLDEASEPIIGAHVFILNSTIGEITDTQGKCELVWPEGLAHQLIVSHISYENRSFGSEELKKVDEEFKVTLKDRSTNLSEAVVVAKRDNKWKKNYKLFEKVLLGDDKAADKCEILNPEVLRFENKNERFKTTSIGVLLIRNDFLGYDIEYLLDELVIEKDGSKHYIGQAKFTDLFSSNPPENIVKRRDKTFVKSRRHFLKSLINEKIKQEGYSVSINKYHAGQFIKLSDPDEKELIKYDDESGFYQLYFPEFLQVINRNVKEIGDSQSSKLAGLESTRFNNNQSGELVRLNYAVSQLYKVAPFLILDTYGNVYNSSEVKEYGFWAEQRLASMLPLNYKIVFETRIESDDQGEELAGKLNQETELLGLQDFLSLFSSPQNKQLEILDKISKNWDNKFYASLLEVIRMSTDDWMVNACKNLIEEKSEGGASNYYDGLRWLWSQNFGTSDYYPDLKAELYQYLDPKFKQYFSGRVGQSSIEFDEILWGGVKQDGIPPLRNPKMITKKEADYLAPSDVVFGVFINGIAKAFPKRILAWHEFFTDDFGDLQIAGVYCTLCGTVIAYDMTHDGVFHDLGTSGFLYRSNKLMYDKATQSLWNTIEGKPVVGPLFDKNIELETYPVVTTTWGQWKKMHPNTEVLSLDTGYDRNYGEGVAYKSYFSNDELMFPVPDMDNRLKNKAEVFVLREEGFEKDPFAISIDYLKSNRIYQTELAGKQILVIAETDGLARAYESEGVQFHSYKKGKLLDVEKEEWVIGENQILSPSGKSLQRLSGHNIFWFAWVNTFPNTRLVK